MKYDWSKERIEKAVINSDSLSDVLNKLEIPRLGNNSKTLRAKILEYNIDISHFTYGNIKKKGIENYIPAETYLHKNSKIAPSKLKEKLLKENYKENKCECCGISEWRNMKLVILLHHIDGDNTNNELTNLLMLCPNCHSQTENYCGSAIKKHLYYCSDCGKEITRGAVYCNECRAKHNRKVDRPDKETLILDFIELKSFTQIGRKYKVSDNSVKKWFIYYNLPSTVKEAKLKFL